MTKNARLFLSTVGQLNGTVSGMKLHETILLHHSDETPASVCNQHSTGGPKVGKRDFPVNDSVKSQVSIQYATYTKNIEI